MNAVVLKIENNKAAVLDENGSFRIIENKAYSRGQIIDLAPLEYPLEGPEAAVNKKGAKRMHKRSSFPSLLSRHLSQAAAIVICIVLAGGMSVYAAPVKTVTSDMTPSLSYQLNVFNRVVRVEPVDEAYTEVVKELTPDIAGKKLERAVDITRTTLEKTQQEIDSKEADDESSREADIDEKITDTDTDPQPPAEPVPETGHMKPENLREGSPNEMAAPEQEEPPDRENRNEGKNDPGIEGPEMEKGPDPGGRGF